MHLCYQFWILDLGFWTEKSLVQGTFGVTICSQAKAKHSSIKLTLPYEGKLINPARN